MGMCQISADYYCHSFFLFSKIVSQRFSNFRKLRNHFRGFSHPFAWHRKNYVSKASKKKNQKKKKKKKIKKKKKKNKKKRKRKRDTPHGNMG